MGFNAGLLVEKITEGQGVKSSVTSVTPAQNGEESGVLTCPSREKTCSVSVTESVTGRSGFREVEQIDIADGWRQIVSGRWRGIGLLEVLEEWRHIWGRKVLIAEPGRDRRKLQEHYPGTMIFTPAEFMDAVEHWPENKGVILAKRTFSGEIVNLGKGIKKEAGRGVA